MSNDVESLSSFESDFSDDAHSITTTALSFDSTAPLIFSPSQSNLLALPHSHVHHVYEKAPASWKSLLQDQLAQLKHASQPETLACIVDSLARTMKSSVNDSNSATMLPSLIKTLPTGKEKGTFLSVDVGGSTLRIALVALESRQPRIVAFDTHVIDASIKSLNGLEFFLWIGKHIKNLLFHAQCTHHLDMGLSWSFPIAQLESVDKGTILTMGKGYHVADEIAGWDLNNAFRHCFEKLSVDVTLTAIVNDTIASLISHSYANPSTRAAVILGTGVNSSVVLDSALINTEMSLMGKTIFPNTHWDVTLDANVERPGFQPFETKVSGRYLGEVTRLVLSDMSQAGMLDMQLPKRWNTQYGLETKFMSEFEGLYFGGNIGEAQRRFTSETGVVASSSDLAKIANIVRDISNRAAAWIAVSLVALAQNLDPSLTSNGQTVTIAYSGTVIEKYSGFKDRCEQYLRQEGLARGLNLHLEGALDGTLYGPAIASAMYPSRGVGYSRGFDSSPSSNRFLDAVALEA